MEWKIRAANNRPQIRRRQSVKVKVDDVRHYAKFLAEFACVDRSGKNFRVRVAELDGRKFFIVQCDGEVVDLLEI
jgi:hypothetical protein